MSLFVSLEGPTLEDGDDLFFELQPVETITGTEYPPLLTISNGYLKNLKALCDSTGDEQEYYCYDDLKEIKTKDGSPLSPAHYVLLNSVSSFGSPFTALLHRIKAELSASGIAWEVVGVHAPDLLGSPEFKNASIQEKVAQLKEKIESLLSEPEEYSTIHLIYPFTPGRAYPFQPK